MGGGGEGGGVRAHVRTPPTSLTHWPEKDKVWTFKSGITGPDCIFRIIQESAAQSRGHTGISAGSFGITSGLKESIQRDFVTEI